MAHAGDKLTSDRYYLTAWALASYLAFEGKALTPSALDTYARATFRKVDAQEAFCDLVRVEVKSLPQFEKQFHVYLEHLRPNGTVSQPR